MQTKRMGRNHHHRLKGHSCKDILLGECDDQGPHRPQRFSLLSLPSVFPLSAVALCLACPSTPSSPYLHSDIQFLSSAVTA